MANLSNFIPEEALKLTNYTGKELVVRLGEDIVRNVVASVLSGNNVRDLTESLTQRRILLLNSSLFVTYIKALGSIENLTENLNQIITKELRDKRLDKNKKTYLQWFLGITGKSLQNVLRGNTGLTKYLTDLDDTLSKVNNSVINSYGDISLNVDFDNKQYLLKWPSLLRCLFAIGSQTLSIRGSEKSMYGKMFEKLILGSVLTILGFRHISKDDTDENNMVFWLSQREDKRESDATIIIKPGEGVRFDIGFIGQGNTEVSLDKVSRFEREMERGRQKYYTSTIILVDKIGDNSRIVEMAKKIDGSLIQMSMNYWVKELASTLNKVSSFKHPILKLSNEESIDYINNIMTHIDLKEFI